MVDERLLCMYNKFFIDSTGNWEKKVNSTNKVF